MNIEKERQAFETFQSQRPSHWRLTNRAAWEAALKYAAENYRPAQTEQQPVAWQLKLPDGRVTLEKAFPSWAEGGYGYEIQPLYAAPIPQTAPQGKFAMGDRVRKTSGSEWQGRICGTYSTALTPEGYAVESEAHAGSVQIYPAKALEAVR